MTEDLDDLLTTCETRLELDAELLDHAREQLSDINGIIAYLENIPLHGDGVNPAKLQTALKEARTERQQTKDLLETLETRHAETKVRYEQLTQRLSDRSE